ncbi:HTH-type transcriptional regulator VirS [Roseivivax jejudonensis]|uniref:HTH-type transcriptional regulator VirS n=1 Tax=Roseivivax jejudonensis TaxID=1529041 RepID=A0A1X6YML7_9RHOB|nr:HTH-type transcriptional regulator VirS [Roseivivax jejudonensis]
MLFGAVSRLFGVTPLDLVQRAGLPARIATGHGVRVTADEFFALWDAGLATSNRDDLLEFLGTAIAAGAAAPVFFALSCAPDLTTGLKRFARYKHAFGPVLMSVRETPGRLQLRLAHPDTRKQLSASMATTILIVINEKASAMTARRIVPVSVRLPVGEPERQSLAAAFGTAVEIGDPELIYRELDTALPLISENESLWRAFEADLEAEAVLANHAVPFVDRVRACLKEAISDRDPSIAYVCERLGRSRTGLLRELASEGATFQNLLNETRETLTMRYLTMSDIPVKQIANMLAYRDANAFHRAFRSWTGRTPGEVRKAAQKVDVPRY